MKVDAKTLTASPLDPEVLPPERGLAEQFARKISQRLEWAADTAQTLVGEIARAKTAYPKNADQAYAVLKRLDVSFTQVESALEDARKVLTQWEDSEEEYNQRGPVVPRLTR